MNWATLIGKKIVAMRGFTHNGKTPLIYILFDDNQTFIQLDEQDPYDYHDCSSFARHLELRKDPKKWEEMMNCINNYAPADNLASPF